MTNRRDTPVVRGEPVEKLLDALARPPEPHDEGADALPPNTMAVLAQARELREDLARVIQAVEYLPVERCDFFIDSLRPWQSKVKETKRQRKRAWQEVEDAARSTDPDTPQRQQAMNEPFASVLRDSGVLTFLKVTYRPIRLALVATFLIRVAILAVVAVGGFILDQTIDNVIASIAVAIFSFAFLDLLLVDRWLEPRLEAHRFRTVLAACKEAVAACQNIEANPQQLAPAFDGVIVRED